MTIICLTMAFVISIIIPGLGVIALVITTVITFILQLLSIPYPIQ